MNDNGSGLSASDVLALDNNRGDFMNGGMGAFWIFALLLLGNGGFYGNNNRDTVTSTEMQISQNAQTQALSNQQILDQINNNKFDVVTALTNQNNSNLINAIQGFNTLGLQVTNQTNVLSSQIQQLGAQMNECLTKIFYAIRNLFVHKTVGTYAW